MLFLNIIYKIGIEIILLIYTFLEYKLMYVQNQNIEIEPSLFQNLANKAKLKILIQILPTTSTKVYFIID